MSKKNRNNLQRTLSEGHYYHKNNKSTSFKQNSVDFENNENNPNQHSMPQLPIQQDNNNNNNNNDGLFRKLSNALSQRKGGKQKKIENATLHGKSKAFFSSKFVITFFTIFATKCIFYFILAAGVWSDTLYQQVLSLIHFIFKTKCVSFSAVFLFVIFYVFFCFVHVC